jgi:hypothetical protein
MLRVITALLTMLIVCSLAASALADMNDPTPKSPVTPTVALP